MSRLGLFGYGSLVLHESASMTLGRPAGELRPVRLHDWRRRFSQRRDNLTCEKTFECAEGWRPEWILGLNVEQGEDEAGPVNGVVIELTEAELDRLDVREVRYDRVDVTGSVGGEDLPQRIVTYTAKPFHFAPEPPEDAVILAHLCGGGGDRASRPSGPRSSSTTAPPPPTRWTGWRRTW